MSVQPKDEPNLRRVIIIGGGFGGMQAARILADERVRLKVIDRNNYHLFQPLLYQIATAELSPADIAMPIRQVLHSTPNTEVLMAEVHEIDPNRRIVRLDDGKEHAYDYLIVATGAQHSYFGHDEWESVAPGLKSLEDGTAIRGRILTAFERAERTDDPKEREAQLTFAIVGGGPTGMEVAGAIADLANHALVKDFDRINPRDTRVIVIEAGPRVLAGFSQKSSERAKRYIEKRGVEVRLNKRVTNITEDGVYMGEEFVPCRTVIWAAGVRASPVAKSFGVPLDRAGRVIVNQDLSIPGHPEIFIVGDLASVKWKDDQTVPGMAPGAMQEGRHAARNILRLLAGESTVPFKYKDKGFLATIGRNAAVADVGKYHFGGWFAWLLWVVVHIFYLIGFRNRMIVMIQWAWYYVTWQRGTRLITTPPVHRMRPAPKPDKELEATQTTATLKTVEAPTWSRHPPI